MKYQLALVAALTLTSSGYAQDLSPALDPVQIGQGQVLSSAVRTHGQLAARHRGPTRHQARACASRGKFRRDYGATHYKVRQLDRLCRSVGL